MIRTNKGLTLIEILIVLVLASILLGALYRTLIGQQKAYTLQEQVVNTQQNVRAAIEQIVREIRMAGYRKDILASLGNINGFIYIITPVNNANHIGKSDDQITTIIAGKAITYKLQWDDQDPTLPVLVRDDHNGSGGQLIAKNIENLQFIYTLSDGTVTSSPANPETIRMVQVTITARTKMRDPDLRGDGYRRRQLTSLVEIRNLGL